MNEQVVLVDEAGRPVGLADKATVHGARTPRHLAFSCYGFDATDRLLVTRRAATKRAFPGVLTNTCCGHPGPGEALEDAVPGSVCRSTEVRRRLTPTPSG